MYEIILNKIRIIKQLRPELRINQIMTIAANKAGWTENDLFYCSDELVEIGLGKFIDQISRE